MSWTITADLVPDLARGAAVLGTGGGGDPYVGALLAGQALAEYGPVEVVSVDEVPADAVVVTAAMMGAPTVMVEKLPGIEEVARPVRELSEHYGAPITHIACAEVGGVNSTIPLVAAAALGLPLIDGDGMGRAFPELQMVLPTLDGIEASPLAYADEKGNVGVLRAVDNHWVERIARVAAVEMGCSIMISGFQMSGEQAARALVRDSLSTCLQIGRTITAAQDAKTDPVLATADLLGGRTLFSGKVVDVERKTNAGFARGTARLEAASAATDGTGEPERLELSFQNEHLVARLGDQVMATTPDLIIVLDHDSGEPVTTEALRYGQRVSVLAAPADERWHSPEGIELVGPRYFGYDLDPHRFDGTVRLQEAGA